MQRSTPKSGRASGSALLSALLATSLLVLATGCQQITDYEAFIPPESSHAHDHGPGGEGVGGMSHPLVTGFLLPWSCNEANVVTQGNNGSVSHFNLDAYAWDFGMARGRPVRAAKAGTVTVAALKSPPGSPCYNGCPSYTPGSNCCGCFQAANQVNVRHADGTESLYLHLDSITVTVGSFVNAGDQVGTAGTSGCSTGTHLHFMVMGAGCTSGYCQSIPAAFSDVSTNGGVPLYGQTLTSRNCGGGSSDPLRAAPQRAARNALGQMVVVTRRADGRVFNRVLTSTGWTAWAELPGSGVLVEEPVLARNLNGRLTAFGIGSDRALYVQSQSTDTAWGGAWVRVGGSFASHVAVGQNADGRLEAFGRGTDNALWRTNQTAANGTGWTAPASLGGTLSSDPAVARDAAGLLNVFLVGTGGRFFRIQQLNGQWTGFIETTGTLISSAPSVARRSDGRLIVFARSQSNNELLRQEQSSTTAGSGYSGWFSTGGVLTSAPNAIYNEATRLVEVFVRNTQGGGHRLAQTSTGWGAWIDMGGSISGAPSAALGSGLRPEVYVVGGEGLYRQAQSSTGGWPTVWELVGRPL